MKNIFKLVLVIILAGCSDTVKSVDYKFDPVKPADVKMSTCDKPDSELNLNDFKSNDTIVVTDTIESMDRVSIDCDGNRSDGGHGPIRNLSKFVEIIPPEEVKEQVNFIHVSNLRTCSDQKLDGIEDQNLEEHSIVTAKGDSVKIPGPVLSAVGISGTAKILLSDSKYKMSPLFLNAFDKNNVLVVRYYGKCLKYRSDKNEKLGESYNCTEAQLIAEKRVLVSIQIERPDVPGIHESTACTK